VKGSTEPQGDITSYHEYKPLNASREHILEEYANVEFRDEGVEQPMKIMERIEFDKSKYCRFHKYSSHATDDCLQLKDAIEYLI